MDIRRERERESKRKKSESKTDTERRGHPLANRTTRAVGYVPWGPRHEHKNQSQRMTASLSEKTESATYVKRTKVESSVRDAFERFLSFPYR